MHVHTLRPLNCEQACEEEEEEERQEANVKDEVDDETREKRMDTDGQARLAACNPTCARLQPYVCKAATLRVQGCNPT